MTPNRVTVSVEKYEKYIPKSEIYSFEDNLVRASNECLDEFMAIRLKNKWITLILSLLLGSLGVDRFYIGDIGLGVTKLIIYLAWFFLKDIFILALILRATILIWSIADWFLTFKATKVKNYNKLVDFLWHNRNRSEN